MEEYREMMHNIWNTVPDAAVSSDFIVGFCGETDEDFAQSVAAVREFRFKNSFIFKYSPRTGTKADDRLVDDVPHDVKQWRNNELLAVQDAISEEENQRFVGRTMEVLVEGPSKTSLKRGEEGPILQLTGRTHCDRIVVFDGTSRLDRTPAANPYLGCHGTHTIRCAGDRACGTRTGADRMI